MTTLDKLQGLFQAHYRSGDTLLINADCMDVTGHCGKNEFQLSVVDPPYNIGGDALHSGRLAKGAGKLKNRSIQLLNTKFDEIPLHENYFEELFRVSNNQIIWGMNYFELPRTRCIVCWIRFSRGLILASRNCMDFFRFSGETFKFDNRTGGKIHATEKPISLYVWLYKNFAKPGQLILDTHGGSFSSAIAAHYAG